MFTTTTNNPNVYQGFDFDKVTTDLFGTKRTSVNNIGAIVNPVAANTILIDKTKYGTTWFSSEKEKRVPKIHKVATADELLQAFKNATSGDVISLQSTEFTISEMVSINKEITITSSDTNKKATINFTSENTAFSMQPKGKLHLQNVILNGNGNQNAFTTLDKNMSKAYDLFIKDAEIHNFKSVLEVSKGSFADTIMVSNSLIKNCVKGINLHKETNDGGD